jgi:hypothetical protein
MNNITTEINKLETLVDNENNDLKIAIEQLKEAHTVMQETFRNQENIINALTLLNTKLEIDQDYYRTSLFESNQNYLENYILDFLKEELYKYFPQQIQIYFEIEFIKNLYEQAIEKYLSSPVEKYSYIVIFILNYFRGFRVFRVYELIIYNFLILIMFIIYLNNSFNKSLICFII